MRILLAEDEAHMANVLKRAMKAKSIAVDHASDGEEALYLGSVSDYDVILLDVLMPKMKGLEVCSKLRKKGVKTPVIMLSAQGSVPDKIRGLDSGADDYLAKPFSFSELMARIRAHARRKNTFKKDLLRVQDLRLDRRTRKVRRAGVDIELPQKEYRMLEYMMQHKGKVLSRYEILENVWGAGDNIDSNLVDVHVSYLRKKMDHKDFKEKLLRTVRGAGYVIG
jgi:two-component system OmpR family response regulator